MTPRTETPTRTIQLSAYYDAAATTTREADYGNFFASLSEDFYFSSTVRALTIGRIRREVRNNPYLLGLFNKYPEAIGHSNLRSRTSNRKYNHAKDLFWYRYAKSVTVTADSLRTVEKIIDQELLVAGEIFILLLANGKIQLIPSEFCGSPLRTTLVAGDTLAGREVNGITYAANGLPIGYRFGKADSVGSISFADAPVINARYVIHVFDKDRVMMGRGLPWLIASLRPAHDLYEIERSKTKQIKDANMLTGVIKKIGADKFLEGMGVPETDADTETTDSPATPEKTGPVTIELRNGTFVALEPGEDITPLMSQYNASDYKELIMIILHAISSPVGLPVELWFSGLGDVNYSGFKGLGTQWNSRRRHIIAFKEEKFHDRLHFWRVSKAANEGDLPPNPDGDDDLIQWAWRQTAVLDEEKQRKANATGLASGEVSLGDIWEEKGEYPDEVFDKRRQLWIQLQIAAGNLDADEDHSAVEVPEGFLLRGELPGEVTYPRLPSGESVNEDGKKKEATPSADPDREHTADPAAKPVERKPRV